MGSKSPFIQRRREHVAVVDDTFPTAMHIAAATRTARRLLPAVKKLRDALDAKRASFLTSLKIGRTHLQDAIRLLSARKFSGWVNLLDRVARIAVALRWTLRFGYRRTAVWHRLNAHSEFADAPPANCCNSRDFPSAASQQVRFRSSAHENLFSLPGALKTLAASS